MAAQRTPNRAYYDEFAAGYERQRWRRYHLLIDRLEIELALEYGQGGRILEAGCGTGLLLKEMAPRAATAVGLDLSRQMLMAARERGLQVVHGSLTDLPFADDFFDLACSFKVLAHVEPIEQALAELSRVVRPGGHVIAEFYNPWSLRYLVKRLKPPTAISDHTTDEAVFTRYDTLAAIRAALPSELEIVRVRGIRVFTPFSYVYRIPGVARAFEFVEGLACDAPWLRQLGGFLAVVAQKRDLSINMR